MKKNIPLLVVGVVVVFGGLFLLTQNHRTKNAMPQTQNQSSEEIVSANSSYLIYSKNAYDNAVDKKRVLFFYANWCPICRPVDKDLSETDQIPKEVVIFRVNYNDSDTDQEEKDLAKKYQVPYQHTFVQVDKDGNEIAKWSGGNINEIINTIK